MKIYEIRDPIYGFIPFNEWEKEIIASEAFQRLRRIQQLALTNMVYPGATHSRFEHSLGVMHLATLMYDHIVKIDHNRNKLKEKLQYNDAGLQKDRQLIRLAGLLHDVGHAPFSHASEELMPINPIDKKHYKHEDYTVAVINKILKPVIENHPINKNNYNIKAEEISGLIRGDVSVLGERTFWKSLISSQLDADRCDYLLRDSHHIGVKYGIYDYHRLLNTLSIGIDAETKIPLLGIDRGGWHIAESMVIARYQMFTQVYFHKTRRAYDYHLKQALSFVLPSQHYPSPDQIEDYLGYDDPFVITQIKAKKDQADCAAIYQRNHIKELYCSGENELTGKTFMNMKSALEQNNIWFYEDKAHNHWYKKNDEIMIVDRDGMPMPLSLFSKLIDSIGTMNQLRIYVKPDQINEAIKITETIKTKGQA